MTVMVPDCPAPPAPPPSPHDPAHVVEGRTAGQPGNRRYFCPSIASVDAHIVELRARMGVVGERFPTLVEDWAADIDLLLDHRFFMMMDADG